VRHYGDTGPLSKEGAPQYAWRTQDLINSLICSGFEIKEMKEFHSSADNLISMIIFTDLK